MVLKENNLPFHYESMYQHWNTLNCSCAYSSKSTPIATCSKGNAHHFN